MDYYSTLGVGKNATDDDIKKAYRKLAMKHHPDRGGDESTFKKISEAYDILSDPQKKQIVDLGGDPKNQGGGNYGNSFNQGPFEFHFGGGVPPGMEDIFGRFGFGSGFGRQPMQKNKTLNITIDITLEDVLSGKDINAEITIPGTGKRKMINIAIPAGIESGQQIRYEGMGDDAIRELRPGDLIVNINVRPHSKFRREHNDIVLDKVVSVWDAIIGSSLDIETLDGKTLTINVPQGTKHGTVLSCRGEGLPIMRSRNRGNLLIMIKVDMPKNLSTSQLDKIKSLRDTL
jgi:DnaJ-class molecular chaperone